MRAQEVERAAFGGVEFADDFVAHQRVEAHERQRAETVGELFALAFGFLRRPIARPTVRRFSFVRTSLMAVSTEESASRPETNISSSSHEVMAPPSTVMR